jgi:hypothetical protein
VLVNMCLSSPCYRSQGLASNLAKSLVHWLGRKYETSTPKVLRKFGKAGFLGTKTQTLLNPSDIKRKRHIMGPTTNPYTNPNQRLVREERPNLDGAWSGQEARTGAWDLRDSVLERDNHTCQRCGTRLPPWKAQVDHIKPRNRFKRREDADTQENLHTLCYPCHQQKTQTDQRVLSRVR